MIAAKVAKYPTIPKYMHSQHKDEQRLDELFSKSKKGQLVIYQWGDGVWAITLLRAMLRRLHRRGTLAGLRLDKWDMHFLWRELRAVRGDRSTLKYWMDRAVPVLEVNGCVTVNGSKPITITQKGKAWLFEAEIKNILEPCHARFRYDYHCPLALAWMTEMAKRTPCEVSAQVDYFAKELVRVWKQISPAQYAPGRLGRARTE
jgi:hypothetical protein